MKTQIIAVIILLAATTTSQAREALIMGNVEHGGFGGINSGITQINGETQTLIGAGGAWLINHNLFIGAKGYGTNSSITGNNEKFGYGGIWAGYIFKSNKLVHYSIDTLVGGAQVQEHNNNDHRNDDNMLVIEPGFNIGIAVASFAELTAGISYRYIQGSDHQELSDADLQGVSAKIGIEFGRF